MKVLLVASDSNLQSGPKIPMSTALCVMGLTWSIPRHGTIIKIRITREPLCWALSQLSVTACLKIPQSSGFMKSISVHPVPSPDPVCLSPCRHQGGSLWWISFSKLQYILKLSGDGANQDRFAWSSAWLQWGSLVLRNFLCLGRQAWTAQNKNRPRCLHYLLPQAQTWQLDPTTSLPIRKIQRFLKAAEGSGKPAGNLGLRAHPSLLRPGKRPHGPRVLWEKTAFAKTALQPAKWNTKGMSICYLI